MTAYNILKAATFIVCQSIVVLSLIGFMYFVSRMTNYSIIDFAIVLPAMFVTAIIMIVISSIFYKKFADFIQ